MQGLLERLTESPTARLPSGSPLDLLTTRQVVIFLARAVHRPMTEVARLLRISRETLYCDLKAAWATLDRTTAWSKGPVCTRCRKELPLPGRRIGRRCRTRQQRPKPDGRGHARA